MSRVYHRPSFVFVVSIVAAVAGATIIASLSAQSNNPWYWTIAGTLWVIGCQMVAAYVLKERAADYFRRGEQST